jgi:hypothetical protein
MARKKWERIADEQFAHMDKEWQHDWADLRALVQHR